MDIIKPGYTRISEIISRYSGYDKIPPDILQAACDRGTAVHEIIDAIISGIGYPEIPDNLRGYIESFYGWYADRISMEFTMPDRWYADAAMITGKCDCLIKLPNGFTTLVDFKTSAKLNKTWKIQGGGYHFLADCNNVVINEIEFVKLDKSGDPAESFLYRPHDAAKLFTCALEMHKYLSE